MGSDSVNFAYKAFIGRVTEVMNRVISIRTTQTFKLKTKGWLTTGIKKSCKTKKELRKGLRNGWVSNEYFRKYTSILQRVCRQAKLKFNTEYIANAENKCKASWTLVNKITKKSFKKTGIFDTFSVNNNNNNNKENLLNDINNFFINACPDVKENRPYDMTHVRSIG